jgi:protein SCO1/2
MLRTLVSFAVLLTALGLATSCGGDRPAGSEARTYTVRGVYVAPQYEGQAALIDHEHIPGYMDAMRMALKVEDPAALEGLDPGAKIAFELVVTDDDQYIRALQRLPDSTTLHLSDAP